MTIILKDLYEFFVQLLVRRRGFKMTFRNSVEKRKVRSRILVGSSLSSNQLAKRNYRREISRTKAREGTEPSQMKSSVQHLLKGLLRRAHAGKSWPGGHQQAPMESSAPPSCRLGTYQCGTVRQRRNSPAIVPI